MNGSETDHNRREPARGQESVWDYPRPPTVELTAKHIQVVFDGLVIADTRRAQRVLETSHPPVYYFPPEDDGERVRSQAGDFYGGWVTSDVVGPFKGGPGPTTW